MVSTNSIVQSLLIHSTCVGIVCVFFFSVIRQSNSRNPHDTLTLYSNYTLQTWAQKPFREPWTSSPRLNSACARAGLTFSFWFVLLLLLFALGCRSYMCGQERSWAFQMHWNEALCLWKASPLDILSGPIKRTFNNGNATYSLVTRTLTVPMTSGKMCCVSLPHYVLPCENAMLPRRLIFPPLPPQFFVHVNGVFHE